MEHLHHLDCNELRINNRGGKIVITCNWNGKVRRKEEASEQPPLDEPTVDDGSKVDGDDTVDKIGKAILLGSVIARFFPR